VRGVKLIDSRDIGIDRGLDLEHRNIVDVLTGNVIRQIHFWDWDLRCATRKYVYPCRDAISSWLPCGIKVILEAYLITQARSLLNSMAIDYYFAVSDESGSHL